MVSEAMLSEVELARVGSNRKTARWSIGAPLKYDEEKTAYMARYLPYHIRWKDRFRSHHVLRHAACKRFRSYRMHEDTGNRLTILVKATPSGLTCMNGVRGVLLQPNWMRSHATEG